MTAPRVTSDDSASDDSLAVAPLRGGTGAPYCAGFSTVCDTWCALLCWFLYRVRHLHGHPLA